MDRCAALPLQNDEPIADGSFWICVIRAGSQCVDRRFALEFVFRHAGNVRHNAAGVAYTGRIPSDVVIQHTACVRIAEQTSRYGTLILPDNRIDPTVHGCRCITGRQCFQETSVVGILHRGRSVAEARDTAGPETLVAVHVAHVVTVLDDTGIRRGVVDAIHADDAAGAFLGSGCVEYRTVVDTARHRSRIAAGDAADTDVAADASVIGAVLHSCHRIGVRYHLSHFTDESHQTADVIRLVRGDINIPIGTFNGAARGQLPDDAADEVHGTGICHAAFYSQILYGAGNIAEQSGVTAGGVHRHIADGEALSFKGSVKSRAILIVIGQALNIASILVRTSDVGIAGTIVDDEVLLQRRSQIVLAGDTEIDHRDSAADRRPVFNAAQVDVIHQFVGLAGLLFSGVDLIGQKLQFRRRSNLVRRSRRFHRQYRSRIRSYVDIFFRRIGHAERADAETIFAGRQVFGSCKGNFRQAGETDVGRQIIREPDHRVLLIADFKPACSVFRIDSAGLVCDFRNTEALRAFDVEQEVCRAHRRINADGHLHGLIGRSECQCLRIQSAVQRDRSGFHFLRAGQQCGPRHHADDHGQRQQDRQKPFACSPHNELLS